MCPTPDGTDQLQTTTYTGLVPSCIPSDDICQVAFKHAAANIHPLILAHSIRVFLLAQDLSRRKNQQWHQEDRLPLLFTACLFHDIGTSSAYAAQPLRFEIEGGDAARHFLARYDVSEADQNEVWMAIALHDTPQVAERFPGPGLVRLVRLAVLADFKRKDAVEIFLAEDLSEWERAFPRGEIEKVLGDAVVEQAVRCPQKAPPACWPGGLYRAHLEDPTVSERATLVNNQLIHGQWTGVNKAF